MTHDELLIKINHRLDSSFYNGDSPSTLRALLSVVELHKPDDYDNLTFCNHCCSEIYPCPTIKSIEKELE